MPEFDPGAPFELSFGPDHGQPAPAADFDMTIVRGGGISETAEPASAHVPIVASENRRPLPEKPAGTGPASEADAAAAPEDHPADAASGGDAGQPPQPPGGGEAAAAGEDPADRSPFRELLSFIDQQAPKALGGMFAAVVNDERLSPRPEPADPDAGEDESAGLAQYDLPNTQRADLTMDHGTAALQHEAALRATGLQVSPDVFLPRLDIADGERFAQALAEVPEDPALRENVADIVRSALDVAARTRIPPEFDEFHPGPQDLEDPVVRADNQTVAQLLSNAHPITEALEGLGAKPELVDSLRMARAAEVEGVLPLYAPYRKWGLDRPPTTNDTEREWTQWLFPEEWQPFNDYVDRVAAGTPEGSRFAHEMASTAIAHIQRARDGEYVESGRRPAPPPEPDDYDLELDDIFFHVDDSPEAVADREAFARNYDALLAEAQEKLRRFL